MIGVRGAAHINGIPARRGMPVGPGDELITARGAELIVVVGAEAMLVRPDSQVRLSEGAPGVVYFLRVLTGAVLGVFRPGETRQVRTPTAVIGIRGTAAYVAVERDRTYVCICYGTAELAAVDDPAAAETVTTRHHDEPRYIYRGGMPAMIETAPVINHRDAELVMLEALVGRQPAFTGKY